MKQLVYYPHRDMSGAKLSHSIETPFSSGGGCAGGPTYPVGRAEEGYGARVRVILRREVRKAWVGEDKRKILAYDIDSDVYLDYPPAHGVVCV